ncbi:MAG TPA: FAD-dependent monooxygenase [Pseudonocardiaceae bacterium]|nr:FAD-dependent monooxygenase [Pseudonocardiaceae bacterium]
MNIDVIVIGAGPTGLMVATELETAGVSAVVVDRLAVGSKMPRAAGMQPRTNEMLDMRGLLAPMRAVKFSQEHGRGHFAGLSIDYMVLRPSGPLLHLEQNDIEAFLEQRLRERGLSVLRGHELTGIEQDEHGVTATVTTPDGETLRITGKYLVAADGAHSTARRLLGLGFPGREGTETALVADVKVRNATARQLVDPSALLGVPAVAEDGSWAMVFGLAGGWRRLVSSVAGAPGRAVPVTEAEVADTLHRVFGPEVELLESRFLSRISDAARQVPRYRAGRVLLAGDAAHIHLPFGGQGLNLGVQDALNLSWKLIAAVRGHAPEGLLDTYHAERYPIAAQVLDNARVQGLLANFGAVNNVDQPPLRDLFRTLIQLPEVNRFITGILSGVDIQYPMPTSSHPLAGKRFFDIELSPERGALLDPTDAFAGIAGSWADRVEHRRGDRAVLLRPDGYVAWASDEPGDTTGLADALAHWFGPAMATVTNGADVAAETVAAWR